MFISRRSFILSTLGAMAAYPNRLFPNSQGHRVLISVTPASGEALPSSEEHLEAVSLRGFGTLSATFHRYTEGGNGSSLVITCGSEASADLVLAKYLSDLGNISAVQPVSLQSDGAADIPARHAADQGYLTAFRTGSKVTICTAAEAQTLMSICAQAASKASVKPHFTSSAVIPMYLNRWDKHGFIFYYSVFLDPPGADSAKQPYDVKKDFDYAAQQHTGLAVWDDESANDSAEGLMNIPWWEWTASAATADNLPLHINSSLIPTTWLFNRYRDETVPKMPQFSGSFYRIADPYLGGQGVISWGSHEGADTELGLVQSSVRRFVSQPNVVGWLEPHSELGHGKQQLFLEYGPVADRSYQEFLKTRYHSIQAISTRWFGDKPGLKTWDDVTAPELADFLGWGPEAFDLTGEWRVKYEDAPAGVDYTDDSLRGFYRRPVPTVAPPSDWFAPSFDDSGWGTLRAPGDDRVMFGHKRPAIYRRQVEIPSPWRTKHHSVWLYIWNLNMAEGDTSTAYVNGQMVGESTVPFFTPQWTAFDVSAALTDGTNHFALRLPNGYLGYRVYLSPDPPVQYPALGPQANARWADYADWTGWLRFQGVRRGAEMIRQVDPDRPITFMSPDVYVDQIKLLAEQYGGQFHDTGLMAGIWCDLLPMLARGSDLPFDLEPGGPAANPDDFRLFMGRYLTEGIQGISYFMHIGDILWHDDIRAAYEAYHPLLNLVGKCHIPKAEVAVLFSQRCERLMGYPWGSDPNINLPGGYWSWNVAANLLAEFPRDGLTENDFGNGNADAYKVVIDTNTSIMDDVLIDEIEAWVKRGGTFVTFVHTGRHTTSAQDSWPISRLTGYRVDRIERYDANNQVPDSEWSRLSAAPAQDIFPTQEWNKGIRANGLRLSRSAPDCQDLLHWDDGSVAVGMRPLGKGFIVQVGAKFSDIGIMDRIEMGGNTPETQHLTSLLKTILDWRGIAPVPGYAGEAGDAVLMRHNVSNDGLYDVWILTNRDRNAQMTDLIFAPGTNPVSCLDVRTGQAVPVVQTEHRSSIPHLRFSSLETRAFLTPRNALVTAPLDWLRLQRGWWQGTTVPEAKSLPTPAAMQHHAHGLSEDWAFFAVDNMTDAQVLAMTQPGFADSQWPKRPLGIWGVSDLPDVQHGLLRKQFTVPTSWKSGPIGLWIQSWTSTTFLDQARIYLDGHVIRDFGADGIKGNQADGVLKAGQTYVVAIEVKSEGRARGVRGNAWLSNLPDPLAQIDLSGQWIPSRDILFDDAPISLPGACDTLMMRRSVLVDKTHEGRTAVIHFEASGLFVGVIVNGSYVRRHHHGIGDITVLNITPWVQFGSENEITIVRWNGPGQGEVKSVALYFYEEGQFH